METLPVLRLEPRFHERVWGGRRLGTGPKPIGEAWVVHEANRVAGGPFDGRTLGDVTRAHGADLLGRASGADFGTVFPLLIKLIDTIDWLSIQVHPDDARARALEGMDAVGKTEAWYILETEPGSQLIAGLNSHLDDQTLATVIRAGSIIDHVRYQTVSEGDTVFIPAGTLHALGPGLLIYEVQQSSDITYRMFDWNRPASDDRPLHIDQSLAVLDADIDVTVVSRASAGDVPRRPLASCRYFDLESIDVGGEPVFEETGGVSFHALTSVSDPIIVSGDGWSEQLDRYQSLVVPAATGAYSMTASGSGRVLRASVPESNDH